MNRAGLLVAAAAVVALVGCESGASVGSLKDAFMHEVVLIPGVTDFVQDRDVLKFKYGNDIYEATIVDAAVEASGWTEYPYEGFLEVNFKLNGQPLEYFDLLLRREIDPRAIVAAWDVEQEKWIWGVVLEEPAEDE